MILDFISRYAMAALGVLLTVALAALGVQSYRLNSLRAETSTAVADALKRARDIEAEWDNITGAINDAKEVQLRAVTAERDRALLSLRSRPRNRLPPAADAACAGSSPAALNATDASVAVGFGAEFDELRANYAACKEFTEQLKAHQ